MSGNQQTGANPEFDWSWTDEDDSWVPPAVDPSVFSVARVYDYFLGGKDNFAADRAAAEQIMAMVPELPSMARANREFLVRAVRFLAESGVRQFIDLGTGIPTSPSVHEVAREIVPDAKVVYVDIDPVVVVHNRALLATVPGVITLQHDLRQPDAVLADSHVRQLIDFDEPVGLLMVAVLHFVGHDTAPGILSRYRTALAQGSYLVIDVACRDGMAMADVVKLEGMYANSSAPLVLRTGAQIEELFDGLELVEPGITEFTQWRASGPVCSVRGLAGVGRIG